MPVDLYQEGAGKQKVSWPEPHTLTFELGITFPGNLLQSTGGTLKEDIWLHFVKPDL